MSAGGFRSRTQWAAGCTLILGGVLLAVGALAAPGALDPSWDGDGKVVTDITGESSGDHANAMAIQPDGKILVAGYGYQGGYNFAITRFTSSGALDPTFGSGGIVLTDFHGNTDAVQELLLQSDGKIIAVGSAFNNALGGGKANFAVARYLPSGALDATFGTGGKVTADFRQNNDVALDAVLQPDGKIVLAGWVENSVPRRNYGVARFTSSGVLDTSFGTSGKVEIDFSGNIDSDISEFAEAAALQPDGKIVVSGRTPFGGNGNNFGLIRLDSNGALDSTFGGDGKVTTDFIGTDDLAYALAIQPDGKIVAAGSTFAASGTTPANFGLARYEADGDLDPTFDGDGLVTTDFNGKNDEAYAVVIQPNGRIVAGGTATVGTSSFDAALARYESTGALDSSFGTGGKVTTNVLSVGRNDELHALALQANGKIVGAGVVLNDPSSGDDNFIVLRYDGDTVDPTPPSCRLIGPFAGPPSGVYIGVQDTGSGLGTIVATTLRNATLSFNFTPGTTSEVIVTATKINPALKSTVALRVTDMAGNITDCDPVIANVEIGKGARKYVRTFNGIPEQEHYITLQNAAPGLQSAKIWVNGKLAGSRALADGETWVLNVATRMKKGKKNSVRLLARGERGDKAVLVIADMPASETEHHHHPSQRLNLDWGF